ncbi:MAG: hypothetical protein B6I20_08095 [Bacteroidetes bacterium 4572_117]|nr:MAG: hypothetical protein B6I20_08095 [Bacteroidetes bacterium 4572_117]
MENLGAAYEKYAPKKVFVYQKEFNYVVAPAIQTWVSENVLIKLVQVDAQKIAFVVSPNLFPTVSVEQTMEEGIGEQLTIKYFENEVEAKKWLII